MVFLVLCTISLVTVAFAYNKEQFLTDALLREVVDHMGRDLAVAADTYLDSDPSSNYLSNQALKFLENEDSGYPIALEGLDPPSLRDQEYLQHSSLWGNQYMSGGDAMKSAGGLAAAAAANQQMKPDPTLPAYCNPPNPCPVGYSAEDGCLEEFENTAAFSRKYQAEQECMCDTEHMFDCPVRDYEPVLDMDALFSDIKNDHKSLVAKKFHSKKASNPYLEGEKLPIAAKKGLKLETD